MKLNLADRSNGATEKELEPASKLNEAKIYIAQLKSALGNTIAKEKIEIMKDQLGISCSLLTEESDTETVINAYDTYMLKKLEEEK